MKKKNPWLGLASYDEPKGIDDYLFCGRDEDTLDVARLIDNNLFVTLYGSSGIGKTSLLKAGVIPILRRKDYFPLYVRLSQEPADVPYAESIVRRLRDSGLREQRSVEGEHPGGEDRLFLWNYFAITRFFNEEGREVYPVVILDQFEEVFRDADKRKAELLLRQIYLLLNDELEMPAGEGYSADTNYRFVASIREDFLFVLEDSIDALSMDLLKNNRYRLRPMDVVNAREAVLIPGRDSIVEAEKEAVADRIVALAGRGKNEGIDTLLLSLVCACTYDRKAGERITLSDLSIWKDNPMQLYYQDAVKNLSAKQIRYIQQHFVREDGSRRRVDARQVRAALGENCFADLIHGANRMFAAAGQGRVELLHDQLAMAVYEDRKAFEERERKKKLKRRIWLFGTLGFLILLLFLVFLFIIGDQQNDLLRNQARFVAEKAQSLLESNDPNLAEKLCLEVSPASETNPGRPYIPEIERIVRETDSYHYPATILLTSVSQIAISRDGKYLLAKEYSDLYLFDAISFNCLRHWVTNTNTNEDIIGLETEETPFSSSPLAIDEEKSGGSMISCVSFSQDDNDVVVAYNDNDIYILDADTGLCKQIFTTSFQDGYCIKCLFSNDKNKVIGVYARGNEGSYTVCIWDSRSGSLIRTMDYRCESDSFRYSFELSHDGRFLAIGDNIKLEVLDLETGQKRSYDYLGEYYISSNAIAFSPDDRLVVTGFYEGKIEMTDLNRGVSYILHDLESSFININSLTFSPDGTRILATTNRTAVILDAASGNYVSSVRFPESTENNRLNSAYFGRNESTVFLAFDTSIDLWNPNSRISVIERPYEVDSAGVEVQYSPDGTRILYNPPYSDVCFLYDAEDMSCLRTFQDPRESLYEHVRRFALDGKCIVSSFDEGVLVWDADTGDCIRDMPSEDRFALHPAGREMVTHSSSGDTLSVWDLETGFCKFKLEVDLEEYIIQEMVYSPRGKYLFVRGDRHILLLDAQAGEMVLKLEFPSICDAAVSPDERLLAVTTDSSLYIWHIQLGRCLQEIAHKKRFPDSIRFSPDNRYISCSEQVYEVRTGRIASTGQSLFSRDVIFSPDGRYYLEYNSVFERETRTCILNPEMYALSLKFCCFSPDGSKILGVTLDDDNDIVVCDFPPFQELLDQARERYKDQPLTSEERKRFFLE